MGGVFISYRRDDSAGHVGRLLDRFAQRVELERGGVFLDVASIESGVNFRERIRAAIGLSSVVLAVIGKQWLTITDNAGARRLDDPEDVVREELTCALQHGIRVIPVLVANADMPAAIRVPEPLRPLAGLNALSVRDANFDGDVHALLDTVAMLCRDPTSPAKEPARVSTGGYLAVGLLCLDRKDLVNAEACLRAALAEQPDLAVAHVHLAAVFQLDAFNMILAKNFGLARDRLKEAQQALERAFAAVGIDPALLVQMGYHQKELAQAYQSIDEPDAATAAVAKARQHFELAAKYDERNDGLHGEPCGRDRIAGRSRERTPAGGSATNLAAIANHLATQAGKPAADGRAARPSKRARARARNM